MSLPNQLTILRILLIPVICYLLLVPNWVAQASALALYIIAAITDYFDGMLARKHNMGSDLGRMLDPIADKLLVLALIVIFAFNETLSAWGLIPAIAILLREVFVSGLREYLGSRDIVVHVSTLAKYKTTTQLIAFGFLTGVGVLPILSLPGEILLWIAGILTVWTGAQYLIGAMPHFESK